MQTRSTLMLQAQLAGMMAAAMMAVSSTPQPAQTNAAKPASATIPESRQVRRARERREGKATKRRGY